MLIRLVFGIAASLAVTHRLSIPLFGIRARDPGDSTADGVPDLLRAGRVDPLVALHTSNPNDAAMLNRSHNRRGSVRFLRRRRILQIARQIPFYLPQMSLGYRIVVLHAGDLHA
jgi:hypothetical protein